jgi:D-alanine-D-alanine ligase
MSKIRVAVLRGGPSSEYEVSLKSGSSVLSALSTLENKYQPYDVLIDTEGTWHFQGIPVTPLDLSKKIDVVFNALHGEYGEDGKAQRILETFSIPFTGSNSLASSIGMNKSAAKNIFKQHGISTPYHITINKDDITLEKVIELFKSFPHPAVVKPVNTGSSVGVSIVNSFDELGPALEKAAEFSPTIMLEEYVAGREATAGVINHFRGEEVYSLLPLEIRQSEEICPGNFTPEEKTAISKAAAAIHKALGLRHYSRSDFIIHPRRGVMALEVNTLPGLTAESLLPKSLAAVGCSLPEFLDHVITLALEKR